MGTAAAWIATYALVVNVILSSALLASISPTDFDAGAAICANSADISAVRSDAGKNNKRITIHCPMCIGNHVASALPPVPNAVIFERTAIRIPLFVAFDASFVASARVFDHQARGPPHLI